MASMKKLSLVLGTGNIGAPSDSQCRYTDIDDVKRYLNTFRARGYVDIDTAAIYPLGAPGTSEALLGEVGATKDFNVATKVMSMGEGDHSRDKLLASIDQRLHALKCSSVSTHISLCRTELMDDGMSRLRSYFYTSPDAKLPMKRLSKH
jgi:aryl-alcohol dehydrogenase-like predicted oxidoreductase